ncbi:unnamed protein product [Rotaria socialis]|nr:unnamed protein product [Rotaria socialis]
MAGTQFKVISCLTQGDLHIIQLEETIPPLPLVQPPPKPMPSPIKPMPIELTDTVVENDERKFKSEIIVARHRGLITGINELKLYCLKPRPITL